MHENSHGLDSAGRTTGCTYAALVTEADLWHKLWTTDCSPQEHAQALEHLNAILEENPNYLDPLTGADPRAAERLFKNRTAAPDGWRPRSFDLLCDDALEALAQLLKCL